MTYHFREKKGGALYGNKAGSRETQDYQRGGLGGSVAQETSPASASKEAGLRYGK